MSGWFVYTYDTGLKLCRPVVNISLEALPKTRNGWVNSTSSFKAVHGQRGYEEFKGFQERRCRLMLLGQAVLGLATRPASYQTIRQNGEATVTVSQTKRGQGSSHHHGRSNPPTSTDDINASIRLTSFINSYVSNNDNHQLINHSVTFLEDRQIPCSATLALSSSYTPASTPKSTTAEPTVLRHPSELDT